MTAEGEGPEVKRAKRELFLVRCLDLTQSGSKSNSLRIWFCAWSWSLSEFVARLGAEISECASKYLRVAHGRSRHPVISAPCLPCPISGHPPRDYEYRP